MPEHENKTLHPAAHAPTMRGVPRVVAITTSYRRPAQLAQLFDSLATEAPSLAGALVVDNANDPAVEAVAGRATVPVRVLAPGRNLGCGGGVAFGLRDALRDPAVTHAWIFDDDAAATPGALAALLVALDLAQADAAMPLVTNATGHIGWYPGPLAQPAWSIVRQAGVTPAAFRAACGDTPLRWAWAPWPSLLVSRRAIEAVGLPRDDFWFQGEDLEWTLRITERFIGVLAPAAECRHFPPLGGLARAQLKSAAMLQNNSFTATRLPHGRRLLRHAPGNTWRFLAGARFTPKAFVLVWCAQWRGLVRGLPAGAPGADAFRRAWERLG